MALQVGQNGDAYHIYPLFTSGGGSFFGTTATGDPDPKNVTVDSPESIAAGKKIADARREGRRRAQALDRRQERHPALHRQEGAVPGLRPVGHRRHQEGRHQVRHLRRSRRSRAASRRRRSSASTASTSPARARTRRSPRSSSRTSSRPPEFQSGLYKAEPRRPALTAAVEQVKATDPNIAKFADAGKNGTILPGDPGDGPGLGARSASPRPPSSAAPTPRRRSRRAAKAIRDGIADPVVDARRDPAGRSARSPAARRTRDVRSGARGAVPVTEEERSGDCDIHHAALRPDRRQHAGAARQDPLARRWSPRSPSWAAIPLVADQEWVWLAVLVLVTTADLLPSTCSRWHIPLKYLIPGTIFLIAFQVVPVVSTVRHRVHELR